MVHKKSTGLASAKSKQLMSAVGIKRRAGSIAQTLRSLFSHSYRSGGHFDRPIASAAQTFRKYGCYDGFEFVLAFLGATNAHNCNLVTKP